MNKAIDLFVGELKKRPDISGIILFGSWARGNNRLSSDVDLIVIVGEGLKRVVEYRDNQAFEITYTSGKLAMEYWENHINDCFGLWHVAKILYDKDGTVKKLEEFGRGIINKGKDLIDETKIKHLRFDSEDSLEAVKSFAKTDPALANFLLTNKIFWLTELFFDIRQMWTPAPKQIFSKIKEINQDLFHLLNSFYEENVPLVEKIEIANKIIPIVFVK